MKIVIVVFKVDTDGQADAYLKVNRIFSTLSLPKGINIKSITVAE